MAEAIIPESRPERPKVKVTTEGVFYRGREVYPSGKISKRKPFLEAAVPALVEIAEEILREHPEWAGEARDSFRQMGLNSGLVRTERNKLITDFKKGKETDKYLRPEPIKGLKLKG